MENPYKTRDLIGYEYIILKHCEDKGATDSQIERELLKEDLTIQLRKEGEYRYKK